MISREETLKIAKLSKLKFDDEELKNINESMNKILSHIENLNEVDVTNVEPLYSINEITDVTRIDNVKNTVDKKDFLSNAPEKDEDFIILPKIVG
ncbi:Asp-tRNA(Asn)/Glu-tRNA(Gln) amidotransferase subunit GatC [Oceanivirga salmonicida]|uniref:Asp-tRNA(Asn)/Glu-tRNA(Gln) amidotransferase subunit GatC n=1 Tax=Oceanivirga salmonicida TaxID=1769291 RepID=UPI0008347372|nr:Asp-tRNA(Asn)/Glu-tRNA(Gln) amidotransferase subunit GatC [Oceanivirga salmonicida]